MNPGQTFGIPTCLAGVVECGPSMLCVVWGWSLAGGGISRVALGCVFWGLLGVWPFPHCRSRLAVVPAWGGQVHCAQGPGATVETSRAVREEWEWSSAGAFMVFLDRISEELHFLWWDLNITTCPNGRAPRCMKQKLT